MVVENNYGYTRPDGRDAGATPPSRGSSGWTCRRTARAAARSGASNEIAPTVVPKLSLETGLVYTYTKPAARRQRGRLVLHGARLLHRPHGLPPLLGHGPRLQQQLRPGVARARRGGLRRGARRPRAVRRLGAPVRAARQRAQRVRARGRGSSCSSAGRGAPAGSWRGSAERTAHSCGAPPSGPRSAGGWRPPRPVPARAPGTAAQAHRAGLRAPARRPGGTPPGAGRALRALAACNLHGASRLQG